MYNNKKSTAVTAEEKLNEIGYKLESDNEEERIFKSGLYTITFKKQFFTFIVRPIEGNAKAKDNPGISYRLLKAITAEINELINEKYHKTNNAVSNITRNISNNVVTANKVNKPIVDTGKKSAICLDCGNIFSVPGVVKEGNNLIKVCPKCKSHSMGIYFGENK